ncbi:hypothetical protein GCM10027614_73760 [Micromonospora vulcania]
MPEERVQLLHPAPAQLSPVTVPVLPLASGRVVQASLPTSCASTKRKSQFSSRSYEVKKRSSPLLAPVRSTVRVSRLYDSSACPLYRYHSPVRGSNGALPGRVQPTGAELANCGNSSGGRNVEVVRKDAVWSWFCADPGALSCPVNPVNPGPSPATGYGSPSGAVPPSLT